MTMTHALTPVATSGPASPQWIETLRDGAEVLIRPIAKTDAAMERAFIERLSPETRRFRFLGQLRTVSSEQLARFCDIDYDRDFAFVAMVTEAGETREVGVSRYCVGKDRSECECAIVVADDWQHRGLGTALMKHLIAHARDAGIGTMFSIDLADNPRMQELAQHFGFTRRTDDSDPTLVIHTLKL